MKSNIFIAVLLMLFNYPFIVGMYNKKPSIVEPTGLWEHADQEQVAHDSQSSNAYKKIVILNEGSIPFTVKTPTGNRELKKGESLEKYYPKDSYIELTACGNVCRKLIEESIEESSKQEYEFAIRVLRTEGSQELFAIFNKSLALFFDPLEKSDVSSVSETSSVMSIDSPVTSPKPLDLSMKSLHINE